MKHKDPLLSRRDFIDRTGNVVKGLAFAPILFQGVARGKLQASVQDISFEKEAMWYKRVPEGVKCLLCPNACVRRDGQRSRCRVREPRGGKLYSLVYGIPCVIMLDPIAKCPLYHVDMPQKVFSIATAGCNLACDYCQNWQFSQKGPEDTKNFQLSPESVVQKAVEKNCPAIAFFYTEPTIYYEYMWDIATLAKERGLKTVMFTAGYINPKHLRKMT